MLIIFEQVAELEILEFKNFRSYSGEKSLIFSLEYRNKFNLKNVFFISVEYN